MSKQKNGKRRKWVTYKDVLNAYRDPSGNGLADVEKMWDSGLLGKQSLKKVIEHLQQHDAVHAKDAQLLAFCQEHAQDSARGVPRPEIGETLPYATYANGKGHTPYARAPLWHFENFKPGDKVDMTFKKNEIVIRPAR